MAHGLFSSSLPVDDNPIIQTRRNSHTGPIAMMRRASRQGSIGQAHIHTIFMNEALAEARASLAEGGIPVGCVLVRNGHVIARGRNRRIQLSSPILHAEMTCLEAAGRQPASFYHDCTLYTTFSPCSMCAGAIRFYGISRVVIGDNKIYHGDEALLRASNIHVDVLDCTECHETLENFIKERPSVWQENIAHTAH
ncbi:unnamed protein product [Adineta steineri]|uniref:Cytosine deaminase n=1 Tax=Adineta steineri TaxID=433720 RepID=A0A814PSF4_9BILA|nr:unnamed protein product [Adineta steineri]